MLFQKTTFGAQIFIFRKVRGKIKIVITHNLLCRKVAAVSRKIATSCLVTF